jgi:hypothetical protein
MVNTLTSTIFHPHTLQTRVFGSQSCRWVLSMLRMPSGFATHSLKPGRLRDNSLNAFQIRFSAGNRKKIKKTQAKPTLIRKMFFCNNLRKNKKTGIDIAWQRRSDITLTFSDFFVTLTQEGCPLKVRVTNLGALSGFLIFKILRTFVNSAPVIGQSFFFW